MKCIHGRLLDVPKDGSCAACAQVAITMDSEETRDVVQASIVQAVEEERKLILSLLRRLEGEAHGEPAHKRGFRMGLSVAHNAIERVEHRR